MGVTAPSRKPAPDGTQALDPDSLAALEEEQRFLDRSLEDLEREHDAGDLDEADYDSLKSDYAARAAAVTEAIEAGRARFVAARRTTSMGRRLALVAGVAVFAVLCGVLVAFAAGRKSTGPSAGAATPTTVTSRAKLQECFTDGQNGKLLDATTCYGDVIKTDPNNAEALTYLGWFLWLASRQSGQSQLAKDAPTFLERAERADPTYPDAHVFLAVVEANAGQTAQALAELDLLDKLHPVADVQQLADNLRQQIMSGELTTSTTAP